MPRQDMIRARRGTAAEWALSTDILYSGELAWASDTNEFKLGDGFNTFSALPSVNASDATVAAFVTGGGPTETALNSTMTAAYGPHVDTEYSASMVTLSDYQSRPASPFLVAIGDSITDNNHTITVWTGASATRTAAYRADGYITNAMIELSQPFTWFDRGVSGERSDQGLARFDADVAPLNPRIVVEAFGTNDISQGVSAAVTFSNKYEMWKKAWRLGAHVLAFTCPPRDTFDTAKMQESFKLNAMLYAYSATNPNKFTLVDWWVALAEPLTGKYKTTLVDTAGVHPNGRGALAAGSVLASAIQPLILGAPPAHLAMSAVNDTANLLPNPLENQSTGGNITANKGLTGTAPINHTFTSSGTDSTVTGVLSLIARPDGFGNWYQIETTVMPDANATVSANHSASAGTWAEGDTLYAMCEFETDADGWTDGTFDYRLLCVDAASNILHYSASLDKGSDSIVLGRRPGGVLRTPAIVVPPGTTTVRASFVYGGLGKVRVGREVIRKLN